MDTINGDILDMDVILMGKSRLLSWKRVLAMFEEELGLVTDLGE